MDPTAPAASVLSEAIQPPSAARVDAALRRLVALGALSGSGEATRVTSLGRLIAALPVSAPLGRLLVLGDAFGCGRQAAVIAALLSLPDPFLQPYTRADAAPADGDYEAEAKLLSDDISFFKPRLAHFTKRGCSDALATLAMFDEWQRVLSDDGPPAAAQYAHSQHASYKRLAEVEHFSRELSERLKQQRNEFGITAPHAGSPSRAASRRRPSAAVIALRRLRAQLRRRPNVLPSARPRRLRGAQRRRPSRRQLHGVAGLAGRRPHHSGPLGGGAAAVRRVEAGVDLEISRGGQHGRRPRRRQRRRRRSADDGDAAVLHAARRPVGASDGGPQGLAARAAHRRRRRRGRRGEAAGAAAQRQAGLRRGTPRRRGGRRQLPAAAVRAVAARAAGTADAGGGAILPST